MNTVSRIGPQRRSTALGVMLVAISFAAVGGLLAVTLAGRSWGLLLPVLMPAAVPIWTQRRQAAAAARRAKLQIESSLDAEHDPQAAPTDSRLKRCSVCGVIGVVVLLLATLQVVTRDDRGWWLVAASAAAMLLFLYASRQLYRPNTRGRLVAAGLAAWSAGLGGNFTASALTDGLWAQKAQTTLAAPLQPLVELTASVKAGVDRLLKQGEQQIANDTEQERLLREMRQEQLAAAERERERDAVLAKLTQSVEQKTRFTERTAMINASVQIVRDASPVPTLMPEDIAALESIRSEGNPWQQTQAILLLASDRMTPALWQEADEALQDLDADRSRGLWSDKQYAFRLATLRGNRAAWAADPDGSLKHFRLAVELDPGNESAKRRLFYNLCQSRRMALVAIMQEARPLYDELLHGEASERDEDDAAVLTSWAVLRANAAEFVVGYAQFVMARDLSLEGIAELNEALAICQAREFPDNDAMATILVNRAMLEQTVGNLYVVSANPKMALSYLQASIASTDEALALRSAYTQPFDVVNNNLYTARCSAYLGMRKMPEARAAAYDALRCVQGKLPETDPRVGFAYLHVGFIDFAEKRYADACRNYKLAQAAFPEGSGADGRYATVIKGLRKLIRCDELERDGMN